jgi:hypothetical protein
LPTGTYLATTNGNATYLKIVESARDIMDVHQIFYQWPVADLDEDNGQGKQLQRSTTNVIIFQSV